MKEQMTAAMEWLTNAQHGKVNVRPGKAYPTVALRVECFRRFFPELSITTNIVEDNGEIVQMAAMISGVRVTQLGDTMDVREVPLATGHAEEVRGSSKVNKTSALENCETSAIGRALAAFGLLGEEMASANEVEKAVAEQAKPTVSKDTIDTLLNLCRDHGMTDKDIAEYRKSLRLSEWSDLTQERADRLLAKMSEKAARDYAAGESANATDTREEA